MSSVKASIRKEIKTYEDRRIDNAQTSGIFDLEVRINNTTGGPSGRHLCGTDRVVDGDEVVTDIRENVVVGGHICHGTPSLDLELGKGGLAEDGLGIPDGLDDSVLVEIILHELGIDGRLGPGVVGRNVNGTT